MWFIVSGLQIIETHVPENCAVELRRALRAQQSYSCNLAGCILRARCAVEISKQHRNDKQSTR